MLPGQPVRNVMTRGGDGRTEGDVFGDVVTMGGIVSACVVRQRASSPPARAGSGDASSTSMTWIGQNVP